MSAEERKRTCLIVSAHSLPGKILQDDDPYAKQLEETAKLIQKTGIKQFQLVGKVKGIHLNLGLGPDVQDLTRDLSSYVTVIKPLFTRL